MTKSQNTKNEQQKDLCITSEQLTKQWKKGELPSGWYYLKVNEELANYPVISECVDDYNLGLPISYFYDFDVAKIEQVLAPVPSYNEYLSLTYAKEEDEKIIAEYEAENERLKHDVGNLGYKIKNQRHEIDNRLKEIEKLKELLKECFEYIDWTDGTGSPISQQKLLDKIDEVLK